MIHRNYGKKGVNEVINEIAEDFENIVAVTKLKELKQCQKHFTKFKKKKNTVRNKTNKNWQQTWNNVLFRV